MIVPERLSAACGAAPERTAWLTQLPDIVKELESRWSLTLAPPFGTASCAWVAPADRAGGSRVVLKIGMPHLEAMHEIHGLCFWAGNGIVRLFDADEAFNAMLLEWCEPGTSLREASEPEQDVVIAGLLRRLWQKPPAPSPYRHLSAMLNHWASETLASTPKWRDAGLVRDGLRLFEELSRPTTEDVLLATDLHAGNVLRAEREPWLAIDPKPFVGDRAYDATQHLLNGRHRLIVSMDSTIRRLSDLLEVNAERVRLWMFARAAGEPREVWDEESAAFAKRLAPK